MKTYRGKPWNFGRAELITEWESSGGGLFNNPRIVLYVDSVEINRWPVADFQIAREAALKASLTRRKEMLPKNIFPKPSAMSASEYTTIYKFLSGIERDDFEDDAEYHQVLASSLDEFASYAVNLKIQMNGSTIIRRPLDSSEIIALAKDNRLTVVVPADMDDFYEGVESFNDLVEELVLGPYPAPGLYDIGYSPIGVEDGKVLVEINADVSEILSAINEGEWVEAQDRSKSEDVDGED